MKEKASCRIALTRYMLVMALSAVALVAFLFGPYHQFIQERRVAYQSYKIIAQSEVVKSVYDAYGGLLSTGNNQQVSLIPIPLFINGLSDAMRDAGVPVSEFKVLQDQWSDSAWVFMGHTRHIAVLSVDEAVCTKITDYPLELDDLSHLISYLGTVPEGEPICYFHNAREPSVFLTALGHDPEEPRRPMLVIMLAQPKKTRSRVAQEQTLMPSSQLDEI